MLRKLLSRLFRLPTHRPQTGGETTRPQVPNPETGHRTQPRRGAVSWPVSLAVGLFLGAVGWAVGAVITSAPEVSFDITDDDSTLSLEWWGNGETINSGTGFTFKSAGAMTKIPLSSGSPNISAIGEDYTGNLKLQLRTTNGQAPTLSATVTIKVTDTDDVFGLSENNAWNGTAENGFTASFSVNAQTTIIDLTNHSMDDSVDNSGDKRTITITAS